MKHVAVIVGGVNEWKYFVRMLETPLSLADKPYRITKDTVVDIESDTTYHYVRNHISARDSVMGREWHDYITIAKIVDDDVMNYLMSCMRGD